MVSPPTAAADLSSPTAAAERDASPKDNGHTNELVWPFAIPRMSAPIVPCLLASNLLVICAPFEAVTLAALGRWRAAHRHAKRWVRVNLAPARKPVRRPALHHDCGFRPADSESCWVLFLSAS